MFQITKLDLAEKFVDIVTSPGSLAALALSAASSGVYKLFTFSARLDALSQRVETVADRVETVDSKVDRLIDKLL